MPRRRPPITLEAKPTIERSLPRALLGSYLLAVGDERRLAEVRTWQSLRVWPKALLAALLFLAAPFARHIAPLLNAALLVSATLLLLIAWLDAVKRQLATDITRPLVWATPASLSDCRTRP